MKNLLAVLFALVLFPVVASATTIDLTTETNRAILQNTNQKIIQKLNKSQLDEKELLKEVAKCDIKAELGNTAKIAFICPNGAKGEAVVTAKFTKPVGLANNTCTAANTVKLTLWEEITGWKAYTASCKVGGKTFTQTTKFWFVAAK